MSDWVKLLLKKDRKVKEQVETIKALESQNKKLVEALKKYAKIAKSYYEFEILEQFDIYEIEEYLKGENYKIEEI